MTALLIILAVLILLALFPFGVRVTYDQDGFQAWAKAWLFSFQVYPAKPKDPDKEKQKAEKKKRKAAKKEAKRLKKEEKLAKKGKLQPEAEEKKGGNLSFLLSAISPAAHAAGRLVRKIRVKELILRVVWAAKNPADAAVGFGYANAALGTLWGILSNSFKVKKKYLSCGVDYDATSPAAILRATATIRLGQVLAVAVPLLFKLLKLRVRQNKDAAQKNDERGVET